MAKLWEFLALIRVYTKKRGGRGGGAFHDVIGMQRGYLQLINKSLPYKAKLLTSSMFD